MSFESKVNSALRTAYAATNVAGPLHHRCSPEYLARTPSCVTLLSRAMPRSATASNTGRRRMPRAPRRRFANRFWCSTRFSAMAATGPLRRLFPTVGRAFASAWGLRATSSGSTRCFKIAALPFVPPIYLAAGQIATALGVVAGLGCYLSGASFEVSFDHWCEATFFVFARGPVQALALLGGLINLSRLLVAGAVGAMSGLAHGLARTLPVFVPDDRTLPCKNTKTVASLEPLTDVPDAYFFAGPPSMVSTCESLPSATRTNPCGKTRSHSNP